MAGPVEPTNPDEERARGRVALYLDPSDLEWLSRHCCCPADADEATRDRCGRLRFRAGAALHKAGVARGEAVPESTQDP